jgi:hypothetical protein
MAVSGVILSEVIQRVGDIQYVWDVDNTMLIMEADLVWGVASQNVHSVCEAQTDIRGLRLV